MLNSRLLHFIALLITLLACRGVGAVTPAQLETLAFGENDLKVQALGEIITAGDAEALPLLQALAESQVQVSPSKKGIYIVGPEGNTDVRSGKTIETLPDDAEEAVMNNRMRRELTNAIAALRLLSPDPALRLAAAQELQTGARPAMLPLVEKALAAETESHIKPLLRHTRSILQLSSPDAAVRLSAVKALSESDDPNTKTVLLGVLAKQGDAYTEPDEKVRAQAALSLADVERRLAWGERLGQIFSGLSLGSILLLAALGLAITYGLMGVINMAHGELIMIGAYATYVVQVLFRSYMPEAYFGYYLVAALPVAFIIAALVGMVMERSVIRFLYGRPLETLLATWGISLVLIQLVRMIFGAQNVGVENPGWMSGGIAVTGDLVLPYSRIVIIFFSGFVLLGVWLLLTRTRLGLFVRGVTQNRAMAGCVGVPTERVDTYAFGLGSGIAGLAGCALSQIGNVGPDLGQNYIIDSFMVVVLGGVGQLAGTVYAALGLGVVSKFLEGWQGAVLAKIMVLVFIIIFIQKRPQGMFALKGRFADA